MQSQSTPTRVTFLTVLSWTEDQCRAYLEAQRWPDGPVCPKCGQREPYRITRKTPSKNRVFSLYRCRVCKRQYTATVGTIMEDSKIPLNKWFAAAYLIASSKKGMSAHQMHRQLDVSYRSAWFMCHRLREAMRDKQNVPLVGVIEADETYIGGKPRGHRAHRVGKPMGEAIKKAWESKVPVLGMVERGGNVRTMHMGKLTRQKVQAKLSENIDLANSALITDEHMYYYGISQRLPHGVIRHKVEYVRGPIHTQNIESYWANLKRGLFGVFHHVDEGYLGCYLSEFDFRFNRRKITDAERFADLLAHPQGRVMWYCKTEQPENPYA